MSTIDLQAVVRWGRSHSIATVGMGSDQQGPETAGQDSRGTAASVTPDVTVMEGAICQLWRDLIGAERVGLDDDFFELGGNSLLATQFLSRFRSECGVEIPLQQFFESPTPRDLARATEGSGRGSGGRILSTTPDRFEDGSL